MAMQNKDQQKTPAVYLAGDSTVADHGAFGNDLSRSYCGWGQVFGDLFEPGVSVHNLAHGGYSTLSFLNDGYWEDLLCRLSPGDTVLIQFGHNDQKLRSLPPYGGYAANLWRMTSQVKSYGAFPILVTPVSRNIWVGGQLFDMLKDYASAVKYIALEAGVPVIDLHEKCMEFIRRLGDLSASAYFVPGDRTHFNVYGGHVAAFFVAGCIKEAGMPLTDRLKQGRQPQAAPEDAAGQEPISTSKSMPCEFVDIRSREEEAVIKRLAVAGVIDGCTKHFFPDAPVSRAEFAEYLQKLFKWDAPRSFEPPFTDVDALSWHAAAIWAAKRAGVIDPKLLRSGWFLPESDLVASDARLMASRAMDGDALPGTICPEDETIVSRACAAQILDHIGTLRTK